MAGHVLIAGYQIGYRVCQQEHEKWCDCAYTDLPMHRVADYPDRFGIENAAYTLQTAQDLLNSMRATFWAAEAEWRIVECWE